MIKVIAAQVQSAYLSRMAVCGIRNATLAPTIHCTIGKVIMHASSRYSDQRTAAHMRLRPSRYQIQRNDRHVADEYVVWLNLICWSIAPTHSEDNLCDGSISGLRGGSWRDPLHRTCMAT